MHAVAYCMHFLLVDLTCCRGMYRRLSSILLSGSTVDRKGSDKKIFQRTEAAFHFCVKNKGSIFPGCRVG